MTTTTERLDRATFQRRWSDDLAAAHTEARDFDLSERESDQ